MRIIILLLCLAAIALLCDAAAVQRRQNNNNNAAAQKRTNQADKLNVRAPKAAVVNKNNVGLQGQVRSKPAVMKVVGKPAQTAKKLAVIPASKPKQTQTPNGGVKKQQNPVKNGSPQAGSKPQQENQKGGGVRRRRRKNTGVAADGKTLKRRRRKISQTGKVDVVGKKKPTGNNNYGNKNAEDLEIEGSEDVEEALENSEDETPLKDGEATEGEEAEYEYTNDEEASSEGESRNDNSENKDDDDEYYYST